MGNTDDDGRLRFRTPDDEGFVPRFCKALLWLAQDSLADQPTLSFEITMSMLEVYNEEIYDLLAPGHMETQVPERHGVFWVLQIQRFFLTPHLLPTNHCAHPK